MKTVFIVYITDVWHSTSSKQVIAVCTTINECIAQIKIYCYKENLMSISEEEANNLIIIHQTQGRVTNFLINEVKLNELL